MKKFVMKIQDYGQKAAQLQQAIKNVPPKIAEIREAVAMTTGELQQLRTNVQSSVTGLIAGDTASLSLALKEINGAAEVFEQAGYALDGVDMELSPSQRLTVHLARVEDADEDLLKSLIVANQQRRTVSAILSALLRAEEMAGSMQLTGLVYQELTVQIGTIPTVRMCWRAGELVEEAAAPPPLPAPPPALPAAPAPPAPPAPPAAPTPPPQPAASGFSLGSMFERRSTQTATPVAPAVAATTAPVHAAPAATAAEKSAAPVPAGSKDALERFKKDPHYSKYGR
jgi:hypothetical protein